MSNSNRQGDVAKPKAEATKGFLSRTRWAIGGMMLGTLAGVWIGGGTDRYGEDDSLLGGLRGARGTFSRGYRYTVALVRECVSNDRSSSSVRNLGLQRQVENRLWQDKRLAAEAIVVEVEEGGKVVLMGQVPDDSHKEKAVTLAGDTRGVESVVDQLAVATTSRTIDSTSSPAVPTGVASGVRILR